MASLASVIAVYGAFVVGTWIASFGYCRYVEYDADEPSEAEYRLARWFLGVNTLTIVLVGSGLFSGVLFLWRTGDVAPWYVPFGLVLVVGSVVLVLGNLLVAYSTIRRYRTADIVVRRWFVGPVLTYGLLVAKLATATLVLLYGPDGWRALIIAVLWIGYVVGQPALTRALNGARAAPSELREQCEGAAADVGVGVHRWHLLDDQATNVVNVLTAGAVPGRSELFITEEAVHELTPAELDRLLVLMLGYVRLGIDRKRHLRLAAPCVLSIALFEYAVLSPGVIGLGWLLYTPVLLRSSLRDVYAMDEFAAGRIGRESTIETIERIHDANDVHRHTSLLYDALVGMPSAERRIDALERS